MNTNNPWLKPDWPAPTNVHAVTTFRTGGVSQGCYASLNPARHVGDDLACVKENRSLIRTMLALPSEPTWLSQVHSNIAIEAVCDMPITQADASYTRQAGVVCVVMTADCLPVLVCSTDGTQIAAIHAGWRGLLDGVIANTITALHTNKVMVWLGPAIGPEQFEVGAEVRAVFLAKSEDYAAAFKPKHADKWLADIYQLARIELAHLGITAIYGGGYCTVSDEVRFFSFRRDNQTGRMATLIWRD
jgi:polyphenol oxidase